MKYYFAGDPKEIVFTESNVKRRLVSYYSVRNKKVPLNFKDNEIFLDSGAFTAWSKGKVIDIDKYGTYLQEHGSKFAVYANLDVIGNEVDTLTNQKHLESTYQVKPLPTIHYGASLETLKMYAENYDYIALGGLVPYSTQKDLLYNWLNKCFKILLPYIQSKGLKVHGFGIGSPDVLKKYPFYSADSTTWLNGIKFGDIAIWDSVKLKASLKSYKDKDIYLSKGINLKMLEHYNNRLIHNGKEYLKMERDITNLWKERGINYE